MAGFGMLVVSILALWIGGILAGLWLASTANRLGGGESESHQRKIAAAFIFVIPLAAAWLLIPTSNFPDHVADRTSDMNDLRQLALGMLNYESAYEAFPAINGGRTGTGLSWRVHILPFIEEGTLYEKFHLDEPWDSSHNLTLLEEMPERYESRWPVAQVAMGHTLYQRPVGEGTVAADDGSRVRYDKITDERGATVLAVQVDPSSAVPWTQPLDYDLDPETPLRALGHIRDEKVFLVVMCDGTVTHCNLAGVPIRIVNSLFTYAGGEAIPEEVLQRR